MTNCSTMAAAEQEAARDRAERADPAAAPIVNARDEHAAAGRFDLADATQRVIDSIRGGTRQQVHERETARLTTRASNQRTRGAER